MSPAPAGERRSSARRLAWADEALCAGLALIGAVALFRILTDPGAPELGSLCACAAVGYASGWWLVRSRHRTLAAAVSGLVFMVVLFEAGAAPPWHRFVLEAGAWHRVVSSLGTPGGRGLQAACVLAGVAALVERTAFGLRDGRGAVPRPGLAVVPALALVIWSLAVRGGAGARCWPVRPSSSGGRPCSWATCARTRRPTRPEGDGDPEHCRDGAGCQPRSCCPHCWPSRWPRG